MRFSRNHNSPSVHRGGVVDTPATETGFGYSSLAEFVKK